MFETYGRVVRVLRKKLPPAFPVQVRRVKLVDRDGYCEKRNDVFYIRINRELPEAPAIDALLHEWAHARAWNHLHDSLHPNEFQLVAHDPVWGVAYSEVYRVWEQFNQSDIS
jgi:hypothetical protein